MKNRIARGFTLIELMIVVAIIGIVAVVAISAYQDYLARSQMSEAINLLGAGKTPLAEHYADKGIWPAAAADVIGNTSGRYVAAIDVVGGNSSSSPGMTLQATMKTSNLSSLISGRTAWMVTNDGGRYWQCTVGGSNSVSTKYLPGACR